MPPLNRHTSSLLSQVGGKRRVCDDYHEEHAAQSSRGSSSSLSPLPAEALAEEDNRRPPEASDDDQPAFEQKETALKGTTRPVKAKIAKSTNIHAKPRRLADTVPEQKTGTSKLSKTNGTKRKAEDTIDDELASHTFVSGSQDRKRSQKGYGSQKSGYGKQSRNAKPVLQKPKQIERAPSPEFQFRIASNVTTDSSQLDPPSSGATFRKVGSSNGAVPVSEGIPEYPIESSPLSLLSSPPPDDEVEEIDMLPPTCTLCGEDVDETFRTDWEIEHCRGKRMNLKMQEKFCQAHKERNARRTWDDRAYPKVDWAGLEKRLKRHRNRIRAILDGTVTSMYRQDLERKVRDNRSRTAMHSLKSGANTGAHVGYYGSKGAKKMTEYILQSFSDTLRRLASSDKLITSKGVSGGVSGYVQSVLVPELAISLVMEDLGVDAGKAKKIIEESADVGEALHQEEDERMARVVNSPGPDHDIDTTIGDDVIERLVVLDD